MDAGDQHLEEELMRRWYHQGGVGGASVLGILEVIQGLKGELLIARTFSDP